jgi:hypothetical protein
MNDITALALHLTALMVLFAACVVFVAVGVPV